MENMKEIENKAFPNGKQATGSTQSVFCPPLFIDARGIKKRIVENFRWTKRRICLLHGERFHWKNRCRQCRYLITFQVRLN